LVQEVADGFVLLGTGPEEKEFNARILRCDTRLRFDGCPMCEEDDAMSFSCELRRDEEETRRGHRPGGEYGDPKGGGNHPGGFDWGPVWWLGSRLDRGLCGVLDLEIETIRPRASLEAHLPRISLLLFQPHEPRVAGRVFQDHGCVDILKSWLLCGEEKTLCVEKHCEMMSGHLCDLE